MSVLTPMHAGYLLSQLCARGYKVWEGLAVACSQSRLTAHLLPHIIEMKGVSEGQLPTHSHHSATCVCGEIKSSPSHSPSLFAPIGCSSECWEVYSLNHKHLDTIKYIHCTIDRDSAKIRMQPPDSDIHTNIIVLGCVCVCVCVCVCTCVCARARVDREE